MYNVIQAYRYDWNHLDFVYGKSANKLVYKKITDFIRKDNKNNPPYFLAKDLKIRMLNVSDVSET